MMSNIFNEDYLWQGTFAGARINVYKRLARAGEVLYSYSDFNELKKSLEEVPEDDRNGIDAILKFAQVDETGNIISDTPLRTVKLQVKTIRKEKVKYGYNITIAIGDIKLLKNIDLYLQMFETESGEPDFAVIDVKELCNFIACNLPVMDRDFRRTNKVHSAESFYWLPIERRLYTPRVGNGEVRFGLPSKAVMLCSEKIMNLIACANFNVPELKIARGGKI